MRRDGGHVLVELLVASACTALVGAGALSLLVNGIAAAARSGSRLEGMAVADVCRAALSLDLSRALRGFEGTRVVRGAPGARHPIEATASTLSLLLPRTASLETVEEPDGWYRLSAGASSGLNPGSTVVAMPPTDGVASAGTIASIQSVPGGDRVRIDWSPAASPPPVRALVGAHWREFALPTRAAPALRRRDAGGSWQPVVDGVASVTFRGPVDLPGVRPGAPVRGVRVACRATDGGEASGWVVP